MIVCHKDLNTNNNIVHNNKILTTCSMAHIKHYLMLILTIQLLHYTSKYSSTRVQDVL